MKYLTFLKLYFFLTPKKFHDFVMEHEWYRNCLIRSVKNCGWDYDPELILIGIFDLYRKNHAPSLDYKLATHITNKLFGEAHKPCVKMFTESLKSLGVI